MSAIPLRPVVFDGVRHGPVRPSVEALAERIAVLARDRQSLREHGAGAEALEANRLRIVRCQWQLSYALIDRFLPERAASAA